jgi:NAD/NADP transhydrogenase beta subunit
VSRNELEPRHAAVPRRQRLLHPGAQGPVASDHVDPRQPVRHDRHDHRVVTTGALIFSIGGVHAQHDRPGRGVHRVAAVAEPWALERGLARGEAIPYGNRLELFLGAAIGAITFSGSVIAFGKLSGKYKFRLFQGAPVQFSGQHALNAVLGLAMLGCGVGWVATESWGCFFAMLALAFVLGVLIIIPIGGADMPVVVSMLNSYSGWAAAGIGFTLNNAMLIITGALVGSARARS